MALDDAVVNQVPRETVHERQLFAENFLAVLHHLSPGRLYSGSLPLRPARVRAVGEAFEAMVPALVPRVALVKSHFRTR